MREASKQVCEAIEVVLAEWGNETDLSERLDYYRREMKDPEGANKLVTTVVRLGKWLDGADISDRAVETAVIEYWAA